MVAAIFWIWFGLVLMVMGVVISGNPKKGERDESGIHRRSGGWPINQYREQSPEGMEVRRSDDCKIYSLREYAEKKRGGGSGGEADTGSRL